MTEIVQLETPLKPNATIGIIGGGQLGRMLASSAAKFGFRTVVLDPQEGCPAAQVCNRQIVSAYADEAALAQLAEACDVVTYEFENVPLSAARYIETRRPLYPPSAALEVSQDRLVEKRFLESHGVPVAPFRPVGDSRELAEALETFNGGVLKTARFGYDGKGQNVFRTGDDMSASALEAVLAETGAAGEDVSWVLEQLVDFSLEFSIIAARSRQGRIVFFDAAQNVHENGILRRSTVPAGISSEQLDAACGYAGKILEALDYVGVVGVEFFATDSEILVNEIAPRVHNTGHWTVEACDTSQFDQHIRAVAGLPLGSVRRNGDCEMVNLLGDEADDVTGLLEDEHVQVTLYGKAEARAGRKMGHITRMLSRNDV